MPRTNLESPEGLSFVKAHRAAEEVRYTKLS